MKPAKSEKIIQKTNAEEVIPSARRLMTSLRDLGYDFASAVADLVDNAIEANATIVHINVLFKGDESFVQIADNGKGMTRDQLKEAMRYGTEREYANEDLGKFGLGLKTASLSQCHKFSVVSRSDKKKNELNAFSWDLEHIEKENRWEIIRPSKNAIRIISSHYLDENTGTVVYWQQLERMLGYQHPYGEIARKNLNKMCRELEQHLSMVFHRFLAGEVSGREIKIFLNENDIKPWDPFARTETLTKKLSARIIRVSFEGVEGNIVVEPYVLPQQSNFSSIEAFNRASGPANWNQQQGFYIYRADRLIQSGGWSRIRTLDEHLKLARIALRFNPSLDPAFKINVAKMRVQLPLQARDEIEGIVREVTGVAQAVYRNASSKDPATQAIKRTNPPTTPEVPLNNPSFITDSNPGESAVRSGSIDGISVSGIVDSGNQQLDGDESIGWSLDDLENQLLSVAEPDEKDVLQKVFRRFREKLNV